MSTGGRGITPGRGGRDSRGGRSVRGRQGGRGDHGRRADGLFIDEGCDEFVCDHLVNETGNLDPDGSRGGCGSRDFHEQHSADCGCWR